MTCESSSDYCYNATADVTQLNEVTMAGTSKMTCESSSDYCYNATADNLTLFEKAKQRAKDLLKVIG
ncbi:unnamed protein product [Strongylus vulgaris]|uniref:Uncharacterized protein n=1 Tax=Strongylus vulgaris TaxID=40348 RepID=A0A3P7ITA9_STRVU|nr:unnamed protein product [Strongylus vulgaris]